MFQELTTSSSLFDYIIHGILLDYYWLTIRFDARFYYQSSVLIKLACFLAISIKLIFATWYAEIF